MKKVVFTIASLFTLMLVGCSGSGSAGSATSDSSSSTDTSVSTDTSASTTETDTSTNDDGVVGTSGAFIPSNLPDIPTLPE